MTARRSKSNARSKRNNAGKSTRSGARKAKPGGTAKRGSAGTSKRAMPKKSAPKPKRTKKVVRQAMHYGSGFDDALEPTEPIDLARVRSVSDLVEMYGRTAIGARQVGEAADILHAMVQDRKCFVVCTVSGAMTVAKMGLVLCEMIETGMVHAVVSTGALMAHGFVEAAGLTHFKYDPSMNDEALFERGYNRVYDSLELEQNLDDVEKIVADVLKENTGVTTWCSVTLNRALGRWLSEHDAGRGILRSAYENDVPVYVPAFTDSELGLDFAIQNHRRVQKGEPRLSFDPFLDLDDYTEHIDGQERVGIFTVGGGVPRNWAQQVGPYLDILAKRAGLGSGIARFRYGVRICPEPVHWGGLSGCTYSEGVSWGKFIPKSQGGRFAEVYADATIAWPLVVQAVRERMGLAQRERSRGNKRPSRTRR